MRGREILAAVAVTTCALAIGCGSDGTDEPSPGSPSPNSTLTAKQYAELERMYLAMLPLDSLADNSDARSLRHLTRGTARACRQVDRTDPLLAAMVEGCERIVGRLAAFDTPDCATKQECDALLEKFSAALRDLLDTLRETEPIVEREVGDQACRDALLVPEQMPSLERAVDAFDRFADAVTSGDAEAVETTGADVDEALAALDKAPSTKEQLQTFRRDCKPVAS